MNVTELARKMNISPNDLHDKLPELGFDIGRKAIKIDDQLASRIIRAYRDWQDRQKQKALYMNVARKEDGQVILDKKVDIPSVVTVRDFAEILKLPVTRVIMELMRNGVMASLNQRIDFDTAAIVAAELGYETTEISLEDIEEIDKSKRINEKLSHDTETITRAPIIVVMGHVDHGKTKILDAIRKTSVMEGEAGGITQHIGAYQVVKQGRLITFIDTPGHEAFTAMRSRGAKVADIAILVVAATEGVKPQTVEALKIAQEAKIPIIVAMNKIDLPESNPEKVKQELSQYNLLPEDWGGQTIFVPVSAKLGTNIDLLLEQVLLLSDMNADNIKANPKGEFVGSIIEAHVDKGEGPVATVLVKNGTLHQGDYVVVDGILYGRIRMMRDYKGEQLTEAGPAVPAKIIGLKVAPKVGDLLEVVADQKDAKKTKSYVMTHQQAGSVRKVEDTNSEDVAVLNIILRTDVLGSQEAIIDSLQKLETADFKINFISKGLGSISESDVLSADATGAMLIGFNVIPSLSAERLARDKKVTLSIYKIIYELIDEVKKKLRSIAKSKVIREDLGKLEVLAIFRQEDKWEVVGGKVIDGRLEPGSVAAVLRKNEFVSSGKITEIKVGKQAVTDAVKGQECGLKFEGQPIVQVGDILDIYKEREVKKTF